MLLFCTPAVSPGQTRAVHTSIGLIPYIITIFLNNLMPSSLNQTKPSEQRLCQKGVDSDPGTSCVPEKLISQAASDRTRRNGFKLHQGRFRSDIRKNFFTDKLTGPWKGQLREAVASPSPEILKKCVHVVLRDMVL